MGEVGIFKPTLEKKKQVCRDEAICPRSGRKQASRVRTGKPAVSMILSLSCGCCVFSFDKERLPMREGPCVECRQTGWVTFGCACLECVWDWTALRTFYCVYKSPRLLIKMQILIHWVGRAWSRAWNPHFQPAPRCCCCWCVDICSGQGINVNFIKDLLI